VVNQEITLDCATISPNQILQINRISPTVEKYDLSTLKIIDFFVVGFFFFFGYLLVISKCGSHYAF